MQRAVSDILFKGDVGSSRRIRHLVGETQKIDRLDRLFSTVLPDYLREYVHFACIDNGKVTVTTTNGIYATQIRMMQGDILDQLREQQDFAYAYQIVTKVRPQATASVSNPKALHISDKTARLLEQEAKLCDDQDIAAALAALASHGN